MLPINSSLHHLVSLPKKCASQDLEIIMLPALVVFLAIVGNSDAEDYCICNDGLSDAIYQKNIDYACGAGADCAPIMRNGACFQPNTVKDHCNFAVNSYYNRNGQVQGSCSFSNTATLAQDPPPAIFECVYPSSPRAMDSPDQEPVIHISLSIKITLVTSLILVAIGLHQLFQWYCPRRTHLNEEEAANNHNGPTGENELSIVAPHEIELRFENSNN